MMPHPPWLHIITDLDSEVEHPVRHPTYYIPSGDVRFLVETQLFRVHRYFFVRESVTFRNMLCTHVTGRTEDVVSDTFSLEDVTKEEFESFLWIFYKDDYDYEASLATWSAILRLAHFWQFPKIKELATRKMDKLDIEPVDKAVMAREFEVDPAFGWLGQAYDAIGEREEPISELESKRLGLDAVIHLANFRETIQRRKFEQEISMLQQKKAESRPSDPPSTEKCPESASELFSFRQNGRSRDMGPLAPTRPVDVFDVEEPIAPTEGVLPHPSDLQPVPIFSFAPYYPTTIGSTTGRASTKKKTIQDGGGGKGKKKGKK